MAKFPTPSCGLKRTSRGLEALQSNMNDSYHKGLLYWSEPTDTKPLAYGVTVRPVGGGEQLIGGLKI